LTDTTAILREVAAAVRAPDLDRAIDLAEQALAGGVEHALLLNLIAYRLEQQGRLPEALARLERARVLAPADVPTLNALGLCLARLDRVTEAMEAFETAATADPNFAPAHFNLGWTAEQAGDIGKAKAAFERAQALTPGDPAPHSRLAYLAARAGDWATARLLADRALAVDPAEPLANIARAWADLANRALPEAEQRLSRLLQRPDLSPTDGALAHGLLGDVLDAEDRPADAFAEFTAASAALKTDYAERYAAPGRETAADQLAWLIDHMQAVAPMARAAAVRPAAPAAGHVFLVGFPRSGTTLLERALGAHPAIVSWDERENLAEAVRAYMGDPAGLTRLEAASEGALDPLRETYWRGVAACGADVAGKIALDKLPLNTMKLPLIARLFPDAKVIFALRDPRDVVLSCFRQRFRMNASMYELLTLDGAARFYDGVMRLAGLCREKLPLDLFEHRYEDLIADFDAQTQALCRFLGVEWSPRMRDFADTLAERASATPSAAQVARGLYGEGVGQWKRFAAELAPVMPTLAVWMERFGYAEP
jgi:tetratricopeptide (TPR) repeat protein